MNRHRQSNQLSLFDMNIMLDPEDTLSIGTTIYEVLFDQVVDWKIKTINSITTDAIIYGLSREYMIGRKEYQTFSSSEIGEKYFIEIADAQRAAEKDTTEKIKPILDEELAYTYIRETDNYPMKAHIGKSGPNWLYWKSWYSYTFYEEFENSNERNKRYDELNEIIKASEAELIHLDVEELYLVRPGLYASDRYAQRHKTY